MDTKKLLSEIEEFAERVGCAPSVVGRKAGQGGRFYARLKEGRRCWPETAEKVREYMSLNDPNFKGSAQ